MGFFEEEERDESGQCSFYRAFPSSLPLKAEHC